MRIKQYAACEERTRAERAAAVPRATRGQRVRAHFLSYTRFIPGKGMIFYGLRDAGRKKDVKVYGRQEEILEKKVRREATA